MKRENFNADWSFWKKGDEATVETVHLPHDAMVHQERVPRLKNGSFTGFFPSGDYEYAKTIFGKPEYADRTVILEFEGVYMDSTVRLNGEKVGGRVYGYSEFQVDLSGKLRIGQDNEVRVSVHASQVPNARWYPGNGIYRPVNLLVGDREHIARNGISIATRSLHPAVLEISVESTRSAEAVVEAEILYDGKIVAACTGDRCTVEIPDARTWDAEDPNLYHARVVLKKNGIVLDEAIERFGIRTLDWSAAQGLRVNGRSVKLRGGCVHHDNGFLGACAFPAAERRKARILKASGFNAIRSAHNPIGRSMLDACDELGLYIMDEAFDTWHESNGQYGYVLDFDTEWEQDVRDMVLKDRNHPSVVMYSIGNEISDTAKPEGAVLAERLAGVCRGLDPTRPVTVCPNLMMNMLDKKGVHLSLGDKDHPPRKEDVTDPLSIDKDSKMGGSVMINLLVAVGPTLMKSMLKPKNSDAGVRDCYEKVDISGYNYAAKVYEGHHAMHPERIMVGSENNPQAIVENWALVERNPYVIGDFIWTAWDYLGEGGMGVVEYGKRSGHYTKPYPIVSAYSGVIDLTGLPDTLCHLARIVWGQETDPFLAVRPVQHSGEKTFYPMTRDTDAIHSWSWAGCEGRKAEIQVFSRGERVELIQDGRSLGKKKLDRFKARFRTEYRPGVLEAIGYDEHGKELGRSTLRSAGEELVLTVRPETDVLKTDGEDLAFLAVELTDRNGIVKVLEEKKIHVKVEGAGTLQAVGSGSPRTTERYDGSSFTTYNGRMLAVVRSGLDVGELRVTVTAAGVGSRMVVLHVG